MFIKLARLSIYNLLRARARLAMTVSGVIIGTSAVVLLVSLANGLQHSANGIGESGSLTKLEVFPRSDDVPNLSRLTLPIVNGFYNIDGIELVIPILNLQVQSELRAGNLTTYPQVIGLDPRLLPFMELTSGGNSVTLEMGGILIGSQIVTNFYDLNAQDYEAITVDVANTPLEIHLTDSNGMTTSRLDATKKSVLDSNPNFDYTIILPLQTVHDLNTRNNTDTQTPQQLTFDSVLVTAEDREQTPKVSDALKSLGFEVSGIGDFINHNQINSFFNTLRIALGGIGGVALLVSAFGVANTMMMAILERTHEIGLMKAVGASDQDILIIFLVEAALIGLFGGFSGVGISLLIQQIINQVFSSIAFVDAGTNGMSNLLPFDPSQIDGTLLIIDTNLILFTVVLATSVGIVAGLLPALRAARMLPVTALKTK